MKTTPLPRSRRSLHPLALAAAVLCAGSAHGFSIDTGDKDLSARFDNTVRVNLGVRAEKPDPRVLANPDYDESDSKFKRGDFVTKRVDLLSEFDIDYKKQFGLRASAAAWYDNAYDNPSVHTTAPGGLDTSYNNNTYSSQVKRYTNGPSGELLDAFAWVNFRVFDKPASFKLGRHTNYWGEAYLIGAHAISYSQSPVDGVKAVTSPGIELKEVFLPLSQAYLKYQPTSTLSLAAQYFYEWKPSRLPYGGTFFGPADVFFEGTDRLALAPGLDATHVPSVKPGNAGNFGLSAKLNVEEIESSLGLYYRRFNDYNPWFQPSLGNVIALAPGVFVPTTYQLVYPKHVSLVGVSAARVIGPVSVSAEVSYRKDGALNAQGINPVDNEGPRGDTWHALVNGVYLFPQNALFDTGSLVAELAYSRLAKVTSNEAFYRREGSPACTLASGVPVSANNPLSDKHAGCSTRDYLGMSMLFTPQYLQFVPSWDFSLPTSLSYGLHGNAPSSGGGSEGDLSWSVGAKLVYEQKHEFSLLYADAYSRKNIRPDGAAVSGATNDRGWLVFTYKVGF